MKSPVAYEDAVDLLDADHKAVKQMFIDYGGLCEEHAPAPARRALAQRICRALTVHAQLEEEIFYPQVREAIDGDDLIDEALDEHAEAKEMIAMIEDMDGTETTYDATVKQLGKVMDLHVLEEREQIFLKARYAPMDLRGMAPLLLKRQIQLKKKPATSSVEVA